MADSWQLPDRPWSDCPLSDGWSAGGQFQVRINMHKIEFSGSITNSAALTVTPVVVGNLPPDPFPFPNQDRRAMAPGGTSGNPACLVAVKIGADGKIMASAFNNNDNPTLIWLDGVSVPL